MKMNLKVTILAMMILMSPLSTSAQEASKVDKVKFQRGPCTSNLGDIAEIRVPEGFIFADGNDTRLLMEDAQNLTSGKELGLIAPANFSWFVIFEFNETGYIKDDEKNSLDADAMLKNIQNATEKGNIEREKRGWPKMTVLGWMQPPRYNENTHNLEWAIKGQSENGQITNWNTRLLGRKGVMVVTLVEKPERLSGTLPAFSRLLDEGFSYKPGGQYADYRQGDKVAKYGLTALVVGGAAAVATKTGLLKSLWKIIALGFVAVAGFFKRVFAKKSAK